jgi:hypothetical protein
MRMRTLSILLLAPLFLIMGCQNQTPSAALYQSISTDTATTKATLALYSSGTITKADAQTLYTGELAVESSLHVWDAVAQSGNTANASSAQSAAEAAIANLLNQLQAVSAKPAVKAKMKLKATTQPSYKVSAEKAKLLPTDIVSIIELIVELAPEVENWANQVFNTGTVTEPQITQAFSDCDAALASLKAAIATTQPAQQ